MWRNSDNELPIQIAIALLKKASLRNVTNCLETSKIFFSSSIQVHNEIFILCCIAFVYVGTSCCMLYLVIYIIKYDFDLF